jgi:hypothetical protein
MLSLGRGFRRRAQDAGAGPSRVRGDLGVEGIPDASQRGSLDRHFPSAASSFALFAVLARPSSR